MVADSCDMANTEGTETMKDFRTGVLVPGFHDARVNAGITQKEAARRARVHSNTVSRAEGT